MIGNLTTDAAPNALGAMDSATEFEMLEPQILLNRIDIAVIVAISTVICTTRFFFASVEVPAL